MGGEKQKIEVSPIQLGALVIAAMLLLRIIASLSIKAAASYAAKGDERQANRFDRAARGLARMSYMFGEMDHELHRRSP